MITKIALAAFLAFLGFLVYSADQGRWPEVLSFYKEMPCGDKVGHFLLMGTLAFLVTRVLEKKSFLVGRFRVPFGAAVVFLVVCLEEISQIFIPGRTFSFLDLSADLLGILVFGWLASRYPKRKLKPTAATASGSC